MARHVAGHCGSKRGETRRNAGTGWTVSYRTTENVSFLRGEAQLTMRPTAALEVITAAQRDAASEKPRRGPET
jgi:hypothetical protein